MCTTEPHEHSFIPYSGERTDALDFLNLNLFIFYNIQHSEKIATSRQIRMEGRFLTPPAEKPGHHLSSLASSTNFSIASTSLDPSESTRPPPASEAAIRSKSFSRPE